MKISVKTTRYLIAVNAVYFLTIVIALIFALNNTQPPLYFTFLRELLFNAQLIYMIYVLRHLREKKATVITLVIFIILDIMLTFCSDIAESYTNMAMVLFAISCLMMTLSIVLMILFLKLRSDALRLPYSLFALAYLIYLILYMLAGALVILFGTVVIQISMFTILIIPGSLLFVLIQISGYLKTQDRLDQSISQFRTS